MKSKSLMLTMLLTLASSVLASNAFAQGKTTIITKVDGHVTDVKMVDNPPPTSAFNSFSETDADQNGKINQAEARNAGILAFTTADLNDDGWLNESEYEAVALGVTKLPSAE